MLVTEVFSGLAVGVCDGTDLCVDILTITCGGFWLYVLLLMTFDALESSMGHVLELLGCGVGGVIVSSVLQGGLNVGIGVH